MAREIQLTRGFVTIVDDEDFARFGGSSWHAYPNNRADHPRLIKWYARSKRHGILHRAILDAPAGLQVDHINGDSLDNRRANLRLCTHAQNMQNRWYRTSCVGYRGVQPKKRRFRAQIFTGGRHLRLGTFADPIEAARAYDAAARRLHGEFARLNFPDEAA